MQDGILGDLMENNPLGVFLISFSSSLRCQAMASPSRSSSDASHTVFAFFTRFFQFSYCLFFIRRNNIFGFEIVLDINAKIFLWQDHGYDPCSI